MEKLLDLQYGVAGICVLLTIHIVVRVGMFVFNIQKHKQSASEKAIEELTKAVEKSTSAIRHLEGSIGELPKLKSDIRRYYIAVKAIAGDRWPEIRKEITAEEDVSFDE